MRKSIPMSQGIEKPGRLGFDLPGLIGMSFSRVILGGLLSSRARLRFPGRGHSVTRSSSLASKNQPMESCPVAGCLTEGCTSDYQKSESGPNAGFCQQVVVSSVV